jgi:hypothetical protein
MERLHRRSSGLEGDSMTAPECRPPPGTPNGAVCWLRHWSRGEIRAVWRDGRFDLGFIGMFAPAETWAMGYRSVRVFTPPEEPK